MKCPFCGDNVIDLEQHLKEQHFLEIQDYYEMDPIKSEDERCCKCGSERYPLTYIDPGRYFLPHWSCLRDYERNQYSKSLQEAIINYYSLVGSDRFLQMFLISDMYFSATPSHTYLEFKEVLKGLEKPERNKIWFLDWLPGFPKTISRRNLQGIKVIPIDQYYTVRSGFNKIEVNNITIHFASLVPFDSRHHSRYNVFNTSPTTRQVKRLRLRDEKDQCVRFEAPDVGEGLSLFRLERDGQRIKPGNLGELDLLVVKMVLLRNKTFMKLIQSVFEELVKGARVLSDSVFLKNTISLGPSKEQDIHLSWVPGEIKENYINISIL